MSYYVLRPSDFNKPSAPRILYFLKKKDVPTEERDMIVHLKCSSIKRLKSISDVLSYVQMNTADATHVIHPYQIKRIKWNEAVDKFGLDYETDSSDSESEDSTESDDTRESPIIFHPDMATSNGRT